MAICAAKAVLPLFGGPKIEERIDENEGSMKKSTRSTIDHAHFYSTTAVRAWLLLVIAAVTYLRSESRRVVSFRFWSSVEYVIVLLRAHPRPAVPTWWYHWKCMNRIPPCSHQMPRRDTSVETNSANWSPRTGLISFSSACIKSARDTSNLSAASGSMITFLPA